MMASPPFRTTLRSASADTDALRQSHVRTLCKIKERHKLSVPEMLELAWHADKNMVWSLAQQGMGRLLPRDALDALYARAWSDAKKRELCGRP